MSLLHTCTLFQPSAGELTTGVREAIGRLRAVESTLSFDWPPPEFDQVAATFTGEAEGRHVWFDSTKDTASGSRVPFVCVVWATDHGGRHTVRVSAGHRGMLGPAPVESVDEIDRPPAAVVYADHAYLGHVPGWRIPRVLLACPCGMMGELAAIAWMSDRCGPCHDRLAEGVPLPEPLRRHRRELTLGGVGHPVAVSPDGRRFVVACLEQRWGEARIADLESAAVWRTIRVRDRIGLAAFSADGSRLVLLSGETRQTRIQVRSYPDLVAGPTVDLTGPIHALTLSPDGRFACTAEYSGPTLRIDLDGDRVPQPLHAFRRARCNDLMALAIAPDGIWLAGAAGDRDIALLELETDTVQHLGRLQAHVRGLDFTPDGRWLLAVGDHGIEILAVPSLESLGTIFTPLEGVFRSQLVGPWLLAFAAGTTYPTHFLPWQPLLDFVTRGS